MLESVRLFLIMQDLILDKSGNVYVTDSGNNRVEVFAPNLLISNNSKNITYSLPTPHAGISDHF